MRQWGWLNHNEPGVERVTLMRSPGTLRGTIAWSSALRYDVHAERSAIKTSVLKPPFCWNQACPTFLLTG